MELRQYLRVLGAHRIFVVACVVACTVAAGALAFIRTPIYTAKTQLFVAANGTVADPGVTYQGGLFSEQRVLSYVQMVSSPAVLGPVIDELHLPLTVSQLQGKVDASVPTGTVLLNIAVRDRSARQAAAIDRALADEFSAFVSRIETPPGQPASRVTVSITSPAEVPGSPSSPRKIVYVALGVVFGLVLGVGGAFVREARDRRIRDEDDAASAAEAPVLASVAEPGGGKVRPLVVSEQPISPPAEAYRRLQTNLGAVVDDGSMRSLVVTSSVAGEGKTAVAANLGLVYAKAGHEVVVVDANLRRPKLDQMFGLSSSVGLTNVLLGKSPVGSVLQSWTAGVPLAVLASGGVVPNPGELVASERFSVLLGALIERFDIIVFDTPAVLTAAETAVIARQTSGALVVTRSGSTRADDLTTAAETLRAADARLLGVVLNRRVGRGGLGRSAPSLYTNAGSAGLSPLDGERVSVP